MKTLAERETEFIKGMGPSELSKRIAPKLGEIAEELSVGSIKMSPAEAEVMGLYAVHINSARELLRILEQEQFRQRTAIGMYLNGRMDRASLRQISESWNGDQMSVTEKMRNWSPT